MRISDIRATPVSVPLEAPLRHANGCHWGRFVRTVVEVETDDGLVGLGEDLPLQFEILEDGLDDQFGPGQVVAVGRQEVGYLPGDLLQLGRALEGHNAREGNVEAHIHGTTRHVPVLGEAVHDTACLGCILLGHDLHRILACLAGMND